MNDLPSPWTCWLHPKRSSRRIAEAITSMKAESDACLESLRLETARLAAENSRLADTLAEKEGECRKMMAELSEKRDEDLFQRQTESKLAELEEMLGRANEMKQNYEARIARLRSHVRDLRAELRNLTAPSYDSPATIRMVPSSRAFASAPVSPSPSFVPDSGPSDNPDPSGTSGNSDNPGPLDWLQHLPDNL